MTIVSAQMQRAANDAARRVLAYACRITGADISQVRTKKRPPAMDATRRLVISFLYQDLGYEKKPGLEAMSRALDRDHSSVRSSAMDTETRWREAHPEICALFDWLAQHWRDPIEKHAAALDAMHDAFRRAMAGRKRLTKDEIALVMLETARVCAEPEAPADSLLRWLSDTPWMREVESVRLSRARGETRIYEAWARTKDKAGELADRAVRMICDAGHRAMKLPIKQDAVGWRFSWEAVAASLAAFAFMSRSLIACSFPDPSLSAASDPRASTQPHVHVAVWGSEASA